MNHQNWWKSGLAKFRLRRQNPWNLTLIYKYVWSYSVNTRVCFYSSTEEFAVSLHILIKLSCPSILIYLCFPVYIRVCSNFDISRWYFHKRPADHNLIKTYLKTKQKCTWCCKFVIDWNTWTVSLVFCLHSGELWSQMHV